MVKKDSLIDTIGQFNIDVDDINPMPKEEVDEIDEILSITEGSRLTNIGQKSHDVPLEYSILEIKAHNGKYNIEDKLLVIMFLESMQSEHEGEMKPAYTVVSRMFNIPKMTIYEWWQKRKELVTHSNMLIERGFEYMQLKLMIVIMKMTETLTDKKFADMKDRDFTYLLGTLINKIRLMSGMSTSVVEHKHSGSVTFVIPEER